MKVMAAGKAKNSFGLLIDMARAEPVVIEKHGRAVAVVLAVEAYERLTAPKAQAPTRRQIIKEEGGDGFKKI
jgi:prevent-host-death family protein